LSISSGRLRAKGLAIVLGIGALALPAAAEAGGPPPERDAKARVMTRNLYLGADLGPAIAAPTVPAAYTAVGDIYKQMQDANFNARAKLLANEIELYKPHLIGLQEVSHWFRDDVVDGPTTQATETVYDYLELLTDQLARRGLSYEVAVVQNEADLEFPADTSGDGNPDFDARLLMRDVILVREGVQVNNPGSANYQVNASVNTAAFGPVTVKRGYTFADVKINARAKEFRFINTHLESFNAFVRDFQAKELTIGSGVTDSPLPEVLVGDLNSDPDDPSIDPGPGNAGNNDAYETVIDDGFVDKGVAVNTCCFSEDIRDATPAFTSRIDHVLGKGDITELNSVLIGDEQENRSGTGLWPSDHAGVVARLRVSGP
jgi:endonuclease/exonuclease/phosphatase family metal-dependent hydrolase